MHSPTTRNAAASRMPTASRNRCSPRHGRTVATEVLDAQKASLTLHEPGPRKLHDTHGAKP
jgi:hypothetical protein